MCREAERSGEIGNRRNARIGTKERKAWEKEGKDDKRYCGSGDEPRGRTTNSRRCREDGLRARGRKNWLDLRACACAVTSAGLAQAFVVRDQRLRYHGMLFLFLPLVLFLLFSSSFSCILFSLFPLPWLARPARVRVRGDIRGACAGFWYVIVSIFFSFSIYLPPLIIVIFFIVFLFSFPLFSG